MRRSTKSFDKVPDWKLEGRAEIDQLGAKIQKIAGFAGKKAPNAAPKINSLLIKNQEELTWATRNFLD